MQTGRRSFLSMMVMTLAGTKALVAGQQGLIREDPPSSEIPDASGTGKLTDVANPPQWALKAQLEKNHRNLRRDADHLLQLVQELKDEADKTEDVEVMSISLIRKTEEIEKLARHIKGLARST